MQDDMEKGSNAVDASAREQYELEHLARKYGVRARLAKTTAPPRRAAGDFDAVPASRGDAG